MRNGSTVTLTVALLSAIVFLPGCGATRSGGPVVAEVPVTDPSIRRGKAVFDSKCRTCHLHGEGGLGPSLNDKPLPGFLIRFQVRRGLGTMPGFSEEQISDQDLEDLANYVVALRQQVP